MSDAVNYRCPIHSDPFDCPDSLIHYSSTDGYGLIVHDDGSAVINIEFCPWCGTKLPEAEGREDAKDGSQS